MKNPLAGFRQGGSGEDRAADPRAGAAVPREAGGASCSTSPRTGPRSWEPTTTPMARRAAPTWPPRTPVWRSSTPTTIATSLSTRPGPGGFTPRVVSSLGIHFVFQCHGDVELEAACHRSEASRKVQILLSFWNSVGTWHFTDGCSQGPMGKRSGEDAPGQGRGPGQPAPGTTARRRSSPPRAAGRRTCTASCSSAAPTWRPGF